MFRCWNCGADNREEANFCFICGFHLARIRILLDDQRTLEAIQGLYQEMIRGLRQDMDALKKASEQHLPVWGTYCDECGAPVVKGASHCWQCGFHLYPVICPNWMCLTPNPLDYVFCDQCGWDLKA